MSQRLKKRFFEIIEVASPGDQLSRIFDIFIMTLISLNVAAVVLETVESLSSQHSHFLEISRFFQWRHLQLSIC